MSRFFSRCENRPDHRGRPGRGYLRRRFGKALAKTLKGRNALIVASTDLSHYPSAANAAMVDRQTLQAMLPLELASFHAVAHTASDRNIRGLSTRACGEGPVMAAMVAARELGATGGILVSYAHSGDTVLGDRSQVVGYGAVALASGSTGAGDTKTPASPQTGSGAPLNPSDRKRLLTLARDTIERFLTTKTAPLARNPSPALEQTRGMFVTLKKQGELRGCIGEIVPQKPLYQLVGAVALKSALEDPRFRQLRRDELKDIEIENLGPHTGSAGCRGGGHRRGARRRHREKGRPLGHLPPPGGNRTGLGPRRDA